MFRSSSARLRTRIESLNAQIIEFAAVTEDSKPTVFSDGPYYQYFTNRLGWTLNYLHWDDDALLSDAEREELSTALTKHPDVQSAIFLLSTRESGTVTFLTSLGLKVVPVDLCEFSIEPTLSFVERLQGNLTQLKDVTSQLPSPWTRKSSWRRESRFVVRFSDDDHSWNWRLLTSIAGLQSMLT